MSAALLLLLRLLLRRRRLRRLLRRRQMLLLMRSRARRRRRGACWQVRCVVELLERGEKGRRLAVGSSVCTNRGLKPRRGVPVQTHAREAAEARSGGLRSSGTAVVERKLFKAFHCRCADLMSAWSFFAVSVGKSVSGASAKAAVVANDDGFKAAARSSASSSSTSSAASRAGSSVAAAAKASQSMMPTECINRMSYTHARLKETGTRGEAQAATEATATNGGPQDLVEAQNDRARLLLREHHRRTIQLGRQSGVNATA
jgi:hypothetical protein